MKTFGVALIIFLVLPCFFAFETKPPANQAEAEALLKWKSNMSLPSSSSLNSWSLSNLKNICNWTGIACNGGGAVSEINLSHAGLSRDLTQLNFTSFPTLKSFNISSNEFSGAIPPAIGDLSNLVLLDLTMNSFDGSIPPQIGNLTALQYLSLAGNVLTGVLPHQIGNLQKVWFLDLGTNYLESPDWSKVKSFPRLRRLTLSLNMFGPKFPSFIPGCRNLVFLDLDVNSFKSIPESLFTNLEKLEYLSLSHNELSQPLSPNISKLSKLKDLYLSENSIKGEIPSSIGKLKNLQILIISNNRLNSSIPSELGHCTNLIDLELYSNSLSGPLPSSLSSLTNLKTLMLHYNYLNGSIPFEIELEKGTGAEQTTKVLHPCWAAYQICDKISFCIGNSKKGNLSRCYGPGKTVMTIALILARLGKGIPDNQELAEDMAITQHSKNKRIKDELEPHSKPNSISVFVHYGWDKSNDPRVLAEPDVVLTTYDLLTAAYKFDGEISIFLKVDWRRIVRDEAHTIKNWRTMSARAAFTLFAHWRFAGGVLLVLHFS
nr:receptor-like protein 12 [Ipomoea trifida]